MNIFQRLRETLFRVYNRPSLGRWEHAPHLERPVYGVYHIMLGHGWQSLAQAQFRSLKSSGLLDASNKLFVSCITTEHGNEQDLKAVLNSQKVEIISSTDNQKRYEYPALEFIKQLCDSEDCFVYYFHSKGISYQAIDSSDRLFRSFCRKIVAWREMLEYFIFNKWHVAVNVLATEYDTYSAYRWPPRNYTMYSGNFWWATAEHIRRLSAFNTSVIESNRFYSEVWLFEKKHRQFSAFDTIADLYFVRLPRSIYAGVRTRLIDAITFVATYNWRKFQKHALNINYKQRCQKRFQQLKD